jgi:hypothetical protein
VADRKFLIALLVGLVLALGLFLELVAYGEPLVRWLTQRLQPLAVSSPSSFIATRAWLGVWFAMGPILAVATSLVYRAASGKPPGPARMLVYLAFFSAALLLDFQSLLWAHDAAREQQGATFPVVELSSVITFRLDLRRLVALVMCWVAVAAWAYVSGRGPRSSRSPTPS